MNERWHGEKPEELVLFRPNFTTKGGFCTNVGIRATSTACGLPSREKAEAKGKENDGEPRLWREDYLERLFGLPYSLLAHYDVRSCIYRTTYWLNTGEWLPEAVDFYPLMYAGLRPDDADSYDFATMQEREDFKAGCMRLYFCGSAEAQRNTMLWSGLLSRNEDRGA